MHGREAGDEALTGHVAQLRLGVNVVLAPPGEGRRRPCRHWRTRAGNVLANGQHTDVDRRCRPGTPRRPG